VKRVRLLKRQRSRASADFFEEETMRALIGASVLAVGTLIAATSSTVSAQNIPPPPPGARIAVERWRSEPSVSDTVRVALRYFRVHPESLDSMRAAARGRGLAPIISLSYNFQDWRYLSNSQQMISDPNMIVQVWNQQNNSASAGVTWDLREAVFNPGEVQVFGLVSVQRDVMLEITRTYFSRRQLQIRLAYQPPQDPIALESLNLRVQEFTALLDILTGGWFSRTADRR
jgi:hypothetical protein